MEKLLDFLSEARIPDAGMYGLLAFALFCPGFAILYVMQPEVVRSFEFAKLLLFCASCSGPCLIASFVIVHLSQMTSDKQLELKSELMFVAISSSAAVYFILSIMYRLPQQKVSLEFFLNGIHVYLVCLSLIVSYAAASAERGFFSRLFLTFGGCFSLSLVPKVVGLLW